MEQEQTSLTVSTRTVGIRYGLIAGMIGIFNFLAMHLSGLDQKPWAMFIGWLITGTIIYFAHKYYKENGSGYMSYGEGVGISFWIGLISSAIGNVFAFIYISFIDTEFINNLKDVQLEKMQEQGMSDAQIEQAMKFSEAFFTPGAIFVMGLIMAIISAVIVGLIVTIFTQKRNPETAI